MKRQLVRQGDVLLVPTTQKPTAAAKRITDNGRIILAYGEVTGHAHEVIGGRVTYTEETIPQGGLDYDGTLLPETTVRRTPVVLADPDPVPAMELFEEPDGTRLLVIKRDALVRHEEHGPVALAPGGYEVRRQREYEPAGIRNVAD